MKLKGWQTEAVRTALIMGLTLLAMSACQSIPTQWRIGISGAAKAAVGCIDQDNSKLTKQQRVARCTGRMLAEAGEVAEAIAEAAPESAPKAAAESVPESTLESVPEVGSGAPSTKEPKPVPEAAPSTTLKVEPEPIPPAPSEAPESTPETDPEAAPDAAPASGASRAIRRRTHAIAGTQSRAVGAIEFSRRQSCVGHLSAGRDLEAFS